MFDSIYVNIVCPFCGVASLMECQTKELECECKTYNVRDVISKNVRSLDTITQCKSKECYFVPKKTEEMTLSQFSSKIKRTFFNVRLFIRHQEITGDYEILKDKRR